MRKIELVENPDQPGLYRVKLDGKILNTLKINIAVLKSAIRAKTMSPLMLEGIIKKFRGQMVDYGLTPDEIRVVMSTVDKVME